MAKVPFEAIVEAHGATVLRVCRAVLGSADADDAWSETFLSALRAYPDLPAGANHEAWLVTIAHRRAIDAGRARARRAVPTDSVAEWPVREADAPADPSVISAVQSLPDKQRWAVAYHYLADLSYDAVAEIVGVTPAAARRSAADGIANLRRRLDNEWSIP